MNRKIKNQNGVISVFAMTAMLFFLVFMLGAYMAISRNNVIQKESNQEVIELYSTDVNSQDIYNDMVAYSSDIIPLYTYEQVENIGTENFFAIDGKIYYFGSSRAGVASYTYELKSNLSLSENDYSSVSFARVDKGNNKYVDSKSLKLSLDGINNTGTKHDSQSEKWVSLVNNENEFSGFNIYAGGTKIEKAPKWLDNGLALDGSGDYLKCNNILESKNNGFTYEIVFKANRNGRKQYLIGNWNNGGGGLAISPNSGAGSLTGDLTLQNNIKRNVQAKKDTINWNEITYAAMTFDGQKISLYQNGKKISEDKDNIIEKASTESIKYTTLTTQTPTSTDLKVRMGINSFIEKEDDSSAYGISVTPYFYDDSEYEKPTYRIEQNGKVNPSTIFIDGEKSPYSIKYHRVLSDLSKEYNLEFNAKLQLVRQSGIENFELKFGNVKIGALDTNDSFTVIANGSNSVVIKSNIGKIQTWYFNGKQKLVSAQNGEVEVLGTYYYCFDNLEPNTTYDIRAEFSTDNIIANIAGDDLSTIYIGNSIDNNLNGESLNGVIYAVRVYDKALSSDKIQTNYQIDKKRFSIKD